MSPANLGMVFGIVIMQPPDNNMSNIGSSMPKEVCTFLVEHVDEIFEPEDESNEGGKKDKEALNGRKSGDSANSSGEGSSTFDDN
jgi:hypothetical protein